ncbi:MAG: hypothetical protein GF384_04235, partial [Elusimicrobia bacterium]|nr:hypothetical protein [Elusimicrobiota bacterium]MBD3412078.1 hypothetical protein [Elusimicrobiota bacterium]
LGSAICEVISNTPELQALHVVGIVNSSGGIYEPNGIKRIHLSAIRDSILSGKRLDIPQEFEYHPGLKSPENRFDVLEEPIHIVVNCATYDVLDDTLLRRLGSRIIIDMAQSMITESMWKYCQDQEMLMIHSAMTTWVDAFIAISQIVNGIYGVSDINRKRHLAAEIDDEIRERATVLMYDLMELLMSDFDRSVTKTIYEKIQKNRHEFNELLLYVEDVLHTVPDIRDVAVQAHNEKQSRAASKQLKRFAESLPARAPHKLLCSRNILLNTAGYMRTGCLFSCAIKRALMDEVNIINMFEQKPLDYYIQKLSSKKSIERVVAAHHLGNLGFVDEKIIHDLCSTIQQQGEDYQVLTSCLRALGRLGIKGIPDEFRPAVIPVLLKELSDPIDIVRFTARWALQAVGFQDAEVMQQIRLLRKQIREKEKEISRKTQFKEKISDRQGIYRTIGQLYSQVATLYDYQYRLKEARTFYNRAVENYWKSDEGGMLVLETQLRIGRILLQEGKTVQGVKELLHLVDPEKIAQLVYQKPEREISIQDIESGQTFSRFSQGTRCQAAYSFFCLYRDPHGAKILADMFESISNIYQDRMQNLIFKNATTKNEKIEMLVSLINDLVPVDFDDPHLPLLAVYGTELFRDPESRSAKDTINYLLTHRLLVDEWGKRKPDRDIIKLITEIPARPGPLSRLSSDEKTQMLNLLRLLKIIKTTTTELEKPVSAMTDSARPHVSVLLISDYDRERSALAAAIIQRHMPSDLRDMVSIKTAACKKEPLASHYVTKAIQQHPVLRNHQPTALDQTLVDEADIIFVMTGRQKNLVVQAFPKCRQKIFRILETQDLFIVDKERHKHSEAQKIYHIAQRKIKHHMHQLLHRIRVRIMVGKPSVLSGRRAVDTSQ